METTFPRVQATLVFHWTLSATVHRQRVAVLLKSHWDNTGGTPKHIHRNATLLYKSVLLPSTRLVLERSRNDSLFLDIKTTHNGPIRHTVKDRRRGGSLTCGQLPRTSPHDSSVTGGKVHVRRAARLMLGFPRAEYAAPTIWYVQNEQVSVLVIACRTTQQLGLNVLPLHANSNTMLPVSCSNTRIKLRTRDVSTSQGLALSISTELRHAASSMRSPTGSHPQSHVYLLMIVFGVESW